MVRVLDPYQYRCGFCGDKPACNLGCLRHVEEIVDYEGPQNIAAIMMETVTGTNGILIPPDGYLQGLRELCDKHGILLDARRGDVRASGAPARCSPPSTGTWCPT